MKFMTIVRPVLGLGMAMLFFTSCQKGSEVTPLTSTAAVTATTGSAATTNSAAVATNLDNAALLKMVNDVRAAGCNCGTTAMPAVGALTWNDQLAAAALGHSTDMKTNNYFSHTSLSGATFSARVTAAGYKWTVVGENIASGQTTEAIVFNAWLNSEGHCKNMMAAGFKEMGAARAGNYWTQDFGTR